MQTFNRLQPFNRSRLTAVIAVTGSFLALVAVMPISVSNAQFLPVSTCDPGGWQVLLGSVENIDIEHKNIEVRVRGGARAIPARWRIQEWDNLAVSAKSSHFSLSDLTVEDRPGANQKAQFKLASFSSVYKATFEGLDMAKTTQIESGAPVLLVLPEGRCWPRSEKEYLPWMSEAQVAKIVLLQACIEESCVKAKCKGKSECKERVCNCEHAP
jgi:hypothetical protein